jgi:hypothetical protein
MAFGDTPDEQDANARIIAAALDLLDALRTLYAYHEENHFWDEGPAGEGWQSEGLIAAIEAAKAAIAKAEGAQ